MGNTVLNSPRTSYYLKSNISLITTFIHHTVKEFSLKYFVLKNTGSYTNQTGTSTHLCYERCSQWYVLRSHFLGRDTVQFHRQEPVCRNLLPPSFEQPKD
jgi:hypothetical protein